MASRLLALYVDMGVTRGWMWWVTTKREKYVIGISEIILPTGSSLVVGRDENGVTTGLSV